MPIKKNKPIYLQLVDRIKSEVANGILSANDQLPSVREMALQERINPNTVAKAYKELEAEDVIKTVAGKGTFVTGNVDRFKENNRRQLFDQLSHTLSDLIQIGVDKKTIKEFLNGELGNDDAENQ